MASSSARPRLAVVFGTRPEAIKLAPIVREAAGFSDWDLEVWATGQHRELVAGIADELGLVADLEVAVMRRGQSLAELGAALLQALDPPLARRAPTCLIVQGDTSTAVFAGLAGHYRGATIAHVEAGLRTGDRKAPFPEETHRLLLARVTDLHLAPTPGARDALLAEGITPAAIAVTGNTVIDALQWMVARLPADGGPPPGTDHAALAALPSARERSRRLVLLTGHRRESFDGGLAAICAGIAELAGRWPEVDFVYPVHLNPTVQAAAHHHLGGRANVHLLPPVGYAAAVWLLRRAHFAITDSGGLQEEAPTLGTPALVTRAATERPEALRAGYAHLVGHDRRALVAASERWLADPAAHAAACPPPGASPFGDGFAARRCVSALRRHLGLADDHDPGLEIPPWP